MTMSKVIRIEIREHEGCFFATSEQVPGFLLTSKDMKSLDADILPAMKLLLSIKEGLRKTPVKKNAARSERLVAHRELAFA